MPPLQYMSSKNAGETGSLLIELLLSITIFALLVPPLLIGIITARDSRTTEPHVLQANLYLQEMKEALRSIKSTNWNSITNGTFHPTQNGTSWILQPNTQTLNTFTRSMTISDTHRTASTYTLLTNLTGTNDRASKRISYSVTWNLPQSGAVTSTEFITRYTGNQQVTQTSQGEFNTGTFTQTISTINGTVQLSPGSSSSWATPSIHSTYNQLGNNDGIDVFVTNNYAHLITTTNYSIIDVVNPASPIQISTTALPAANNAVTASTDTTYIASANDNNEVVAINTTVKSSPVVATGANLSGNADAKEIVFDSYVLYVGRTGSSESEFVILQTTNPLTPQTVGSYDLGTSSINAITITGNTAYLATTDDNAEIVILDITNKNAPALISTYNLPNTSDALDIFYRDNRLHVGTQDNQTGAEFYILNVTSLSSPSLLGSYNVGNNVNGVAAETNFTLLSTDLSNANFLVLNTQAPTNLTVSSTLNINGNSNRVFLGNGYIFVGNDANNQELVIIRGGVTTPYTTSGTFETSTIDAGKSVGWNYLSINKQSPVNTTLTAQIAINDDNTTWNYVGPDGTNLTAFTNDAAVPLNVATGRYARIRFSFSSDGQGTPDLHEVLLNYSP